MSNPDFDQFKEAAIKALNDADPQDFEAGMLVIFDQQGAFAVTNDIVSEELLEMLHQAMNVVKNGEIPDKLQ